MPSDENQKMNLLSTWKVRLKSHYLAAIVLVALVTAALYLTGDGESSIVLVKDSSNLKREIERENEQSTARDEELKPNKEEKSRSYDEAETDLNDDSVNGCNLSSGRWIFDNNASYPLYKERKCSFMLNDYACEKFGRRDLKYQSWTWQPHDCDLPRFNGTALLEKIRGKKLIFVGDSLNKNQWISMLCLIESSLHPSTRKIVTRKDNLFTFLATDYNATIGFYWSPLLVESNCDDPETHRVKDRIFRIKSIEKHARHWNDADILVFDSFMWWLDPTMTILYGSFESSDAVRKRVGMKLRRYEMALTTWSDWLEININRTKTKLFFMSLSPYHFHEESWDDEGCYNKTEPIQKENYWGISTDREMIEKAESVLRRLNSRGLTVKYLNITNLSDYRRDAHPTIYYSKVRNEEFNKEKIANNPVDCVHWCLPGVPDVWNRILYTYIHHQRW